MRHVLEQPVRGAALASLSRGERSVTEKNAIPAQVCELIRASIHSLEELEILLMLHRERGRSWSAGQISSELRMSETLVVTALQALVANKLAARVGDATPLQHRYLSQGPQAEPVLEELARTYAQNRAPVLMQISSNAIERVREGALRRFSDALRVAGRKRNG
jgi:DNA-binding MarR family transcriptional regulator